MPLLPFVPTKKKVALIFPFFSRVSRTCSVYSPGPSSKERATLPFTVHWVRSTPYGTLPKRGRGMSLVERADDDSKGMAVAKSPEATMAARRESECTLTSIVAVEGGRSE